MQTKVFLTIDVESSMGGAWSSAERSPLPASRHVFCENKHGSWGIPLITGELHRHGLKGTFFCEMLATRVLGEEDTRSITEFLLGEGQDVQLHLHPTFRHYHEYCHCEGRREDPGRFFKSDLLSVHSEDQQQRLLEEAVQIFHETTGRRPRAFRAGSFSAGRSTLRILGDLGIPFDSSYDPCYCRANASFLDDPPPVNRVQRIGKVWEFPITVAKTWSWRGTAFKHFSVSALSTPEMIRILDWAHGNGMEHVVVLFHCFSTVKAKDVAYTRFKPNRIVIGRWNKLLRYLARNGDRFTVSVFGDLEEGPETTDEEGDPLIPTLGTWRPAVRKIVQGLNNFYWI